MYFDYNATAPLRTKARAAIIEVMGHVGNPTSVHSFGRFIRQKIESARETIAVAMKTSPKNVIFTSGATEANNIILKNHKGPVIVSAIEHDSVYAVRDDMHVIRALENGTIDLDHLEKLLSLLDETEGVPLVAVMAAHNETGVIQPVADVLDVAKKYNAHVHIDAVQSFCKADLPIHKATTVALSAHKIGGPSGIGALIKREGFHPRALIKGGGQERGFRSGTENILGIIGFGAAVPDALNDDLNSLQTMRDRFEETLLGISPECVIIGKDSLRLGNTCNFSLPTIKSEFILMHFDQMEIAVSSGAACSSGKVKLSRSLLSMGLPESVVMGAVRVSFGYQTTDDKVEKLIHAWKEIYAKLKKNHHSSSWNEALCPVAR